MGMKHREGGDLRVLVMILALALLGAVPISGAWADEAAEGQAEPPPPEPELTGEALKAHTKAVKKLVKSLHKIKNRDVVAGRIRELGAEGSRLSRDALMAFAEKNKNHEFVRYSFEALSKIGGRAVREYLTGKPALFNRNFMMQYYAAEALGLTRDPEAVGKLIERIEARGTKDKVVGMCAIAVAQCGESDAKALEAVFALTEARKDTIRAYAVEALGHLRLPEAHEALERFLAEDKNARVRAAAATGFGHTYRKDVIPLLNKARDDDKSHQVRDAVTKAIEKIHVGPQ